MTTPIAPRRHAAREEPRTLPGGAVSWWFGLVPALLAVAGVVICLRAQQALTGNLWGVPLDDAYIHFQFARNLATGHGFSFNPGQPIPASTSPLWVVLLAAAYVIGVPLWLSAKVYGVACLALAAVLAWRLCLRLSEAPAVALAAGGLTALDGRLLWAAPSGMEVTLFAALSLAAFLARPRPGEAVTPRSLLLIAALCGLATLARPEGLLLTVVLGVDLLARHGVGTPWRTPWDRRLPTGLNGSGTGGRQDAGAPSQRRRSDHGGHSRRSAERAGLAGSQRSQAASPTRERPDVDVVSWRRLPPGGVVAAVALYVVLVVPYVVFALVTTGHPLPTTFYAKATGIGADSLSRVISYLVALAYYVLTSNYALLLAPVGAVVLWMLRGEARAVVVWPLLLVLEQALLSPVLYHFGRYVMPLQPFFALWAAVGIGRLTRPSADAWRAALPPLALVVVTMLTVGPWANLYALSVRNINDMQVTMAHWVSAHVPRGAPVATHDVGAIGYLSRHDVVDIAGLVTPRFIALERENPDARRGHDVYAEIKRRGARFLIIIPGAYPSLAAQPGLRRVYSVTIRQPVIVPGPTMTVYKLTR